MGNPMWRELGLLHWTTALWRLLALSQWQGRAQLQQLPGRWVPMLTKRCLLPTFWPVQLPEPLPKRLRWEELLFLPAWKLPLQEQPLCFWKLGVWRARWLWGWKWWRKLPSNCTHTSNHCRCYRESDLRPAAGHCSGLHLQTVLTQDVWAQVSEEVSWVDSQTKAKIEIDWQGKLFSGLLVHASVTVLLSITY